MLIWRAARLQCPSRSGDPQRGDRWQKSWVGARGGFEELLRKSRPRLAPPVRATPRRGSAPDQSDPALVESRGIGGRSGDPERDGDATRRLDQRIAEERISALFARPLVRACGEASLAGRSLLGAIYRRLCGVLPISRGCSTLPGRPACANGSASSALHSNRPRPSWSNLAGSRSNTRVSTAGSARKRSIFWASRCIARAT